MLRTGLDFCFLYLGFKVELIYTLLEVSTEAVGVFRRTADNKADIHIP